MGFSHGVAVKGRQIFLAGQVGWNPATNKFETDDLATQVKQALENIVALLREAGAGPEHLVRLTWYLTDKAAYFAARREIGMAYRDVIGYHYPPMSVVVVAGLLDDPALVEIEATAVVPGEGT
jgi:enamine deaminase RidA (YjgF/YER057c/UK114 family)